MSEQSDQSGNEVRQTCRGRKGRDKIGVKCQVSGHRRLKSINTS